MEEKLIARGLTNCIWDVLSHNLKYQTQRCCFVKTTHLPCTSISLANNYLRGQRTFLWKWSEKINIRVKNSKIDQFEKLKCFTEYLFKRCTRTNNTLNFYILWAANFKYTTARQGESEAYIQLIKYRFFIHRKHMFMHIYYEARVPQPDKMKLSFSYSHVHKQMKLKT